jgi:hypothetical protein
VSACDLPAATTKRRYAPAAPYPVDRRTPTQDRTLHSSSAGQIRTLPAWPQSGYFRVNRQVARTSHKVASVISRAWAVPRLITRSKAGITSECTAAGLGLAREVPAIQTFLRNAVALTAADIECLQILNGNVIFIERIEVREDHVGFDATFVAGLAITVVAPHGLGTARVAFRALELKRSAARGPTA